MAISKTRLQRQTKDRRQEKKFFVVLGIITILLIVALYFIYG